MPAVYMRTFEAYEDDLIDRQQAAVRRNLVGNFPIAGRAFPVGVQRYAFFRGYLPDYVSTLTLDVLWYIAGANTAGNVTWITNCAAITPGDVGRLSDKAFSSSTNSVTTAPSGTERLNISTVTITNTDSLAAGDLLIVRVARDPGNATCGGTAVLIGASINYTGS